MKLLCESPARFFPLLLIACSVALAQDNGVRGAEGTIVNGKIALGNVMVAGPGVLEEMGHGLVTGQPYSAEQVIEHKQTLLNGTHIDQKRESQLMYRDSAGRTRTERVMFRGLDTRTTSQQTGLRLIRIYDPVAGYSYTLDSVKHIAHRYTVPVASERPQPVRPAGVLEPQTWSQGTSTRSPSALQNRETKRESMGSSTIDGVTVEGSRLTVTTPAGAEGNDRPLTRVCEHWQSTELQITMLSKCSDPRSGSSVLRVQNLDRAEPDPLLFQVPPDYEIVDQEGPFVMGYKSSNPNTR